MTDNTKDFCLVRKGMIKNIPQKTWIRYITKKDGCYQATKKRVKG